ncbi:MAG: efflux RND transporter permease subunit, partial [Prevotellaceae bacterium]|nr:efflux RND transporter permease subunit [Prevotellaceae bacterium]
MKHRLRTRSSKRTSAFTVIVTFLALSLMGLAIIPLLPVKLNPSRTLPSLTVDFTMTGASARVVEIEVTAKLEAMLARIKGIKNMSSTSANGWGRITLELDKHTRPDAARFEASTIVRQAWAGLPPETGYPVVRLNQVNEAAARPFMTFTVNAPANPILIQRYAEEHIKMRLAQLADIYQITVSGATPMEWRLEYNSKWLQQWGITVSDIRTAVQQHYEREALGLCRTETPSGGQEWIRLFLASDEAATSFDASKIRVAVKDGKVIYLNELVTTTYREQEPTSYYRINGLNSIYLSITSTDNANQLELSTRIHTIMNEIRAGLPAGYEIHTGYDATEYIRTELDKIYFRTAITVAILLLFVLLITLSPRYLFLITVSLSVNMAVAFIFYYLFRLEIQLYSLAGITISLSLIIDNTIVMADHYLRKRTLKVFLSILAATLTTIGALAIIFFLDEEIRVNLQDFAAVVIINMAVSLFVALFLVPAMIDKIGLQRKVAGRKSRWLLRGKLYFNHFYGWLIVKLKRWRVAVFTVFVFAFGLPVFLIPDDIGSNAFREKVRPVIEKIFGGTLRLFVDKVYNGSYFTRNEEVVLSAYASLPQGYTLEQMNTLIKRMETFLTGFSEIKQFQTTISSANQARIFVYFKEEHQRDGFPYRLKSAMIQRALQWGGGSWNISGLED